MRINELRSIAHSGVCAILVFLVSACDLDVSNPNSAAEDQVLSTSAGIIALATGMQQAFAVNNVDAYVRHTAITSREFSANTTFSNLLFLEAGLNELLNSNTAIGAVWSNSYRVIGMADDLIANAPNVPLADGVLSGILGLAKLFKAMSLGFVVQAFEQAPLNTQADGKATFSSRSDVFAEAIRLLDDALQTITATPPSSEFDSNILGSGFDLLNTIQAYRARYNLFAGNFQAAIDAANAVDPAATSVYSYDSQNQNPIWNQVFTLDDYAPRDNFGTTVTDPNDGRLSFYMVPNSRLSDPNNNPIEDLAGFWTTASSPIPAYLPGEMPLTRAEANLGLGNLPAAVAEIDMIRTKTPAQDPFGIGAALPPYSGPQTNEAVTEEIFRQRRAELFLNGTGWEDSRRLGQPGPSSDPLERNRNFYPYPEQERLNNPNTPADPPN